MKKCLILILLALVCRMALASNPTWPAFDTNLNTLNPSNPLPSGYIAPNTNVIATRTWVTNNVHGDTNIVENPYTTNSTANANAYSTNNVADYKGAAHDATNGLGSAAFKNISFFDLAGSATAVTNGYPWGSLYDPSGAAQAATNALGSAAFASKGSFVASTNGIADGLTRTVASTNFAISQPSAGTTNVEAINSSGVEIAVPFADFSGGGSGDFGFTNGINTNAPIGFYYYDTNHFGIGTNSPVGNKSFGSASTNNTGDFDTNGAAAASSIITSNALVSTINALPYTIKLSSTNGIFTPTSNGSGQTNWTFTLTNLAGLDAGFVKLVDARGQTNTGTISLDAGNIHTDIYGGNPSILGTRVQEGFGTTASGSQAHAEGNDTTASGGLSHAEGNSTTASGGNSHAEGSFTIAAGQDSHSEGLSNVVDSTGGVGVGDHAEGVDNFVSADYAHVEGFSNTNTGYYTHVEGASNYVDAIFGHAEGWNNQANGYGTHAEGIGNIASFIGLGAVTAAHAEGYGTTAEGANSHSEGSNTLAYGVDSYAGGANSTASNNSYAWSDGTALISPSNNTYSVTATNGVYLNGGVTGIHGNGLSLTNIPISGINTNGGSAGQVATVSGGSVVWSTPTSGTVTGATLAFPNTSLTGAVSTANGSIGLTIGLTNTPTLNGNNTLTGSNGFMGGVTLTNTGGSTALTVKGDTTNTGESDWEWSGSAGYGGLILNKPDGSGNPSDSIQLGGYITFLTAHSAAIENELSALYPGMILSPMDVQNGIVIGNQANATSWPIGVYRVDVNNNGSGHYTNSIFPGGDREFGINGLGKVTIQNLQNAINGGEGTTNGLLWLNTATTPGTTNTIDYGFKNSGTYYEQGFSQDSGDSNFLGNTAFIQTTNGAITQFPLSTVNAANLNYGTLLLSALPVGMTNLFTYSTNQISVWTAPVSFMNGTYTYFGGGVFTNGVADAGAATFVYTNGTGGQIWSNFTALGIINAVGTSRNRWYMSGTTNVAVTANGTNGWYIDTATFVAHPTVYGQQINWSINAAGADGSGGLASAYGDTLPISCPAIASLNAATNAAASTVVLNPLTINTYYTNLTGGRLLVFVNYILTDSAVSGDPGLVITNLSSGETQTLSNTVATATISEHETLFYMSPNSIVLATNVSSGSASASIASSSGRIQ